MDDFNKGKLYKWHCLCCNDDKFERRRARLKAETKREVEQWLTELGAKQNTAAAMSMTHLAGEQGAFTDLSQGLSNTRKRASGEELGG